MAKTSIYAYSFHFSVDQPSRQYHHQLHHPMDRFKRRGQESSSHLQGHALSPRQSQPKLPPFRDVHYCPTPFFSALIPDLIIPAHLHNEIDSKSHATPSDHQSPTPM